MRATYRRTTINLPGSQIQTGHISEHITPRWALGKGQNAKFLSYSGWSEILQYFQGIASRYGLYKYIKLRHKVSDAKWDEESGMWNVKIQKLDTGEVIEDSCHILINGTGILNNWKWPDIPGLHSFKGDLVHSAAWTEDRDVRDKRVAVLGSGSSGIQIVPAIQPRKSSLIIIYEVHSKD